MDRRDFMRSSAATVAATGLAAARAEGTQPAADGRRPDILVLFTDQWNPRCVGYAGDPTVQTPNIDAIAREGVIFDNAYTPCPVCMPARCSLISGLYPHNHGLWGNSTSFYMPPHQAPMFRDLQAAGYTTAQIGKLHWRGGSAWRREFEKPPDYFAALGLDHCEPIATPFTTPSSAEGPYREHIRSLGLMDAYARDIARRIEEGQYVVRPSVVPPEHHNDSFVAQRAIRYIEEYSDAKPLCLFVSFPGPHTPLDAPGRYATMYEPDSVVLPRTVPETVTYHGRKHTRDGIRRMRANYYGKISLLDDCFGQIVDCLKRRGTWDNTLVVFASDHGEMLGAHGHFSKGRFWEESGRVPLVMRWPGRFPEGRRAEALAELFDIYPTLVEAVGGRVSPGHFARSLAGVAAAEEAAVREAAFSEIGTRSPLNFMVRTRKHKWWSFNGVEQLFDLEEDPEEMNDLRASPAHTEVVADLHERHHQYLRETQYNYAAGYKPMLQRAKESAEHPERPLSEELYERYMNIQREGRTVQE